MTDKEILQGIGRKIKAERQRQGLTQDDLVQKTGFNKMKISRIENGKDGSSVIFFIKICKALGVKWCDQLHK